MKQRNKNIDILIEAGKPFSAEDARIVGVSTQMLAYYCKEGKIERLCRGVYSPINTEITAYPEVQILVKKKVDFVVCLLSALQIHEFTTQLPNALWIAIKQGARKPNIEGYPMNCVWLTEKVYSYGIEQKQLYGDTIKVYSAAKTVADCFKYRNKIGLDIAIEALKEGYRKKMFTSRELHQSAEICRVSEVIRPYEETVMA
jgi:predicted transcriptional regulator of viral defense system